MNVVKFDPIQWMNEWMDGCWNEMFLGQIGLTWYLNEWMNDNEA